MYLLTRSKLGRRVGQAMRRILIERLIEAGVHLFPDSPVVAITAGGVKYTSDGEYWHLEGDTVVLATGVRAEVGLAEALTNAGADVYTIGDVVEPRDAFSALHEAAAIAHGI